MNAHTLQSFIDDWLSTWTGNQPENLLKYYSEDAFYLDPALPSGIQGKDGLKTYFSKLLSRNPEWEWTSEEVIPTEKGCTLKWKAQIPVGEQTITLYGLDIVEINEGQISRNEVYFDRTPWMQAIQALK